MRNSEAEINSQIANLGDFRNVAGDKRHRSSRPAPPGARLAGGKASVSFRRGVQRVDEHNRRRNHVDSGYSQGLRSYSGVGLDCTDCDVGGHIGGVHAKVHVFRRFHHLRRIDEGVLWTVRICFSADLCDDHKSRLFDHLSHYYR